MRVVAAAVGLFILLPSLAKGEDACRWYMYGAYATEWLEQGEERGARIVARDFKWQVDDAFAFHSMSHAICHDCLDDQISRAMLWMRVAEDAVSIGDLDGKVSPQAVAAWMRVTPSAISGAEFVAQSDAVSASLGELEGRARVIGVKYGDGRSDELVALAVAKGCFSLFGVLYANDHAKIAIDRVDAFVRAIGVEWYRPPPDSMRSPRFIPPEDLPLGDAFRRRYID